MVREALVADPLLLLSYNYFIHITLPPRTPRPDNTSNPAPTTHYAIHYRYQHNHIPTCQT